MGSVLDEEGLLMAPEACEGCGWIVEGGTEGCRAAFEALLARDFSDARFFAVHRLFVDCYCLQHPEDYCASAKSLAAHLVGLAQIVEDGVSAATGSADLRNWLDGQRSLDKPALPAERGAMTLGDLDGIEEPPAWREAISNWADSVWAAYAPLHAVARAWLAQTRRRH
jgi:hypothetical protein